MQEQSIRSSAFVMGAVTDKHRALEPVVREHQDGLRGYFCEWFHGPFHVSEPWQENVDWNGSDEWHHFRRAICRRCGHCWIADHYSYPF